MFGLSIVDKLRLVYIYGTTLLLSICSTFFETTLLVAMPNLVDHKNLTRVNSLSESISASASILGPFLGSAVYAIMNIKLFLLINGLSFVFSGISEIFIDFKVRQKNDGSIDEKEGNEKEASMFKDFIDGIKYICTQKWLVALGAIAVLFNMFIIMGLTVPVAYITRKIWGFTDLQYGLLNIMFSVGMSISSTLVDIPIGVTIQKRVPNEKLGRVYH